MDALNHGWFKPSTSAADTHPQMNEPICPTTFKRPAGFVFKMFARCTRMENDTSKMVSRGIVITCINSMKGKFQVYNI